MKQKENIGLLLLYIQLQMKIKRTHLPKGRTGRLEIKRHFECAESCSRRNLKMQLQ